MASLEPGRNDGPQKRRRNYNGEDPLDYEGQEAFAKLLATSRSESGFTSLTTLAETFNVARATIHRWKKDPTVLLRAERLSRGNKLDAQLLARREWPSVVAAMLALAKQGNTTAAKFCAGLAWPEDGQADSRLMSSMTIGEMCRRTENLGEIPTWLRRQKEGEQIAADAAASSGNGNSGPPKLGTDGK